MTKVLNSVPKSKLPEFVLEAYKTDPKFKFAFDPLFKAHSPFKMARNLFDVVGLLDIRKNDDQLYELYRCGFYLADSMLYFFSHVQGFSQSEISSQSFIYLLTNYTSPLEMYQMISDLTKLVSMHSDGEIGFESLEILLDIMDAYIRLHAYDANPKCREAFEVEQA